MSFSRGPSVSSLLPHRQLPPPDAPKEREVAFRGLPEKEVLDTGIHLPGSLVLSWMPSETPVPVDPTMLPYFRRRSWATPFSG